MPTAKPSSLRQLNVIAPLLIMLALLSGATVAPASHTACPDDPVIDAVADLRCWNGSSPIALSGQWHLDYQADREDRRYTGLARIPMRWRDLTPPLPITGRGVYRTAIHLSAPMAHLGLKISRSNMARKVLLIDKAGKELVLFDSGKTDISDQSIVTMYMPIISLPYMEEQSELVIIVRNSESVHGGIEDRVILAPIAELIREEQVLKVYATVISTALAIFFFINIVQWLVRGQDWSLLTLGLTAFFVALRQAAVSGFAYDIFPDLSTHFDSAIGWGTFYGGIVSGHLYFRASYPKLVPRWLPLAAIAATLVGVGLFLSQPLYVVQTYGVYYRLITMLLTGILMGFLMTGLRQPTRELRLTLLSALVLAIGVTADSIYFHMTEYYSVISLSAIGLLVFVGMQTFLMSRRYSRSLRQTANLATELQVLNANLESKVEERTIELAQKNKQLEDLAHTDPLTGIANRRAFDNGVRAELSRAERRGVSMVVGIVDLDYFKSVNDRFGHDVGDVVLIGVAKILRDGVRTMDLVCRWGGEEFSILFPETSADEAFMVSDRLRAIISLQEYSIGSETISVTASIGLAQWSPGQDIDEVFKAADKALYNAKESGRNRVTGAWQMPED